MRVLFVGGVDRAEAALIEAGRALGVRVEMHFGDVKGRGAASLEAMVTRADHVVIVTGINSHGGVRLAKQFARKSGARVWIVRSFGTGLARKVIEDVLACDEESLRRLARCA